VPSILFERALSADWPLPRAIVHVWGVFHVPIGALLLCAALAFAFPERDRPRVLGWLCGGVALHLGVDLLQFHHGQGYVLLFPVSVAPFEFGWIGSEATVPWTPVLAAITAFAWARKIRRERNSRAGEARSG
jgi:hypothetical protein